MAPPGKRRAVDQWVRAVLHRDCDLPPVARLVAIALSRYMDFETLGDARPGTARLAAETGVHARTVQRQLVLLEERTWIRKISEGGTARSGERIASVYSGIPRHSAVVPTAESSEPHGTESRAPRHSAVVPGHDPVKTGVMTVAPRGGGTRSGARAATRPRDQIGKFPPGSAGVYEKGSKS